MKKRVSLLLCVFALLFSAQSACALTISKIGSVSLNKTSMNAKQITSSDENPLHITSSKLSNPDLVQKSFNSYLNDNPSELNQSSSGSTSLKAVGTDIKLGTQLDKPSVFGKGDLVTIRMTELAGEGTIVQNVQVFHKQSEDMDKNDWEKLDAALTRGEPDIERIRDESTGTSAYSDTDVTSKPELNDYKIKRVLPQSAPTSVTSDLYLSLKTNSFSPFIIVWEEVSLYNDVPQTGDAASLAPWLLLLSGAVVLLALRRRLHA